MKSYNIKQLYRYFSSFCSKNLEDLSEMFSDNITLTDWNNQYVGKDEVLKEVQFIFTTFEIIQLDVIRIYNSVDTINCEDGEVFLAVPSDNFFGCQIKISFDNEEPLYIIDLIEFDNDSKIKTIIAYKR